MSHVRAGAAETDITPPLGTHLAGLFSDRPAADVHDPLKSKAVVLDNGDTRAAIVALDLIHLPREEVQAIRRLAADAAGIPEEHILLGCTHTHTGPATRRSSRGERDERYIEWLVQRVADSITLAARRLQPARVAWGQGSQPDVLFCRRFRMRDGTVRFNPGRGNPDIIEPTSPVDPALGLLYVEDEAGQPLAVVAQLGLHYVGTDDPLAISADYYAHYADVMRGALGPQCTPLLLNGTSGQVNNVDVHDPHQEGGHRQARRVARAVAGEALKVIGRLRPRAECALAGGIVPVELPRKVCTAGDLEVARQILAGDDPSPDAGPFSWVVGQPLPASMRPFYAEGQFELAELPETLRTDVQALRVGDSAWVGLPGEIFTEIGTAVKAQSPLTDTFVLGLSTDALGYVPTDRALREEGGYETWGSGWNAVGGGAEGVLVESSAELLRQLGEPA